jgi:2-polyprenyl-3-methyl-5-hydroxy-6-metoxy-1,4-benzoquinol methylase
MSANPSEFVTNPDHIQGSRIPANPADFREGIAFDDHKIAYLMRYAEGRDVLDLGCVCHDPESYRNPYWVHKALAARAKSVTGMDLSREGITYLAGKGFNVVHGDAQNFDLGRTFDCIVAGDLIEHLEDFSGFLNSCKRHLRPGGTLLISTPNPWYWRNIVKSIASTEVPNNAEHTCWLCPRTLRQLVARHGMSVSDIAFGSRFRRDLLMPLPRGIKHTSWHACVTVD